MKLPSHSVQLLKADTVYYCCFESLTLSISGVPLEWNDTFVDITSMVLGELGLASHKWKHFFIKVPPNFV